MTRVSMLWIGLATGLLLVGCEDEVVVQSTAKKPAEEKKPAAAAAKSRRKEEPPPTKPDEAPPKVEFQEEDFAETERSRDPFRSFQDLFTQRQEQAFVTKRDVILEEYSIDDLKLIGIITRIQPAKAMLVDPHGKGHVVHRNELVGKAERVQSGMGGTEYEINWRIDRIRDADVVLVREDPSNPDVPSATRVISLHPEGDKTKRE